MTGDLAARFSVLGILGRALIGTGSFNLNGMDMIGCGVAGNVRPENDIAFVHEIDRPKRYEQLHMLLTRIEVTAGDQFCRDPYTQGRTAKFDPNLGHASNIDPPLVHA